MLTNFEDYAYNKGSQILYVLVELMACFLLYSLEGKHYLHLSFVCFIIAKTAYTLTFRDSIYMLLNKRMQHF